MYFNLLYITFLKHNVFLIMRRFARLQFCTVCLLLVVSATTAHRNVVNVLPSDQQTSQCPSNNCFSLSDLTDSNFHYKSNMDVALLPGTHVNYISESLIEVSDVHDFSLIGMSVLNGSEFDTRIVCNATLVIVFQNVTNIEVSDIFINHCGSVYHGRAVNLIVSHSQNVTFTHVKISNGVGMGISFYDSFAVLNDIAILHSEQWIMWMERSNVAIKRRSLFQNNNGGLKVLNSSSLTFGANSVSMFENNICTKMFEFEDSTNELSCAICYVVLKSKLFVNENSHVQFLNNKAVFSGGVSLTESNMYLYRNTTLTFVNNEGNHGGAMSMYAGSQIVLDYLPHSSPPHTCTCNNTNFTATFISNHATRCGGALYIEDSDYVDMLYEKLLKKIIINRSVCTKMSLILINNTAHVAGSAIYGGWIDLQAQEEPHHNKDWNLYIIGNDSDNSIVTSDPLRICFCSNGKPNCSQTTWNVEVYPGQVFKKEAVAIGQRFGTVPTVVIAETSEPNLIVSEDHHFQIVRKHCTSLRYSVFSVSGVSVYGSLILQTRKYSIPSKDIKEYDENLLQQVSINVHLKECPIGFVLNTTSHQCACHPSLLRFGVTKCDIETQQISKPNEVWINAACMHTKNDTVAMLFHKHCPFDYCKYTPSSNSSCQLTRKLITINLEHPDEQCAYNRSGILCGACATSLSHVLGTSKCKECSSLWILLLVPAIALAGVVLVVFLILLNMTVSIGTINGLIFYANIVRANHAVFFTPTNTNTLLGTFIAWVNLDLGFEVCLYDGLTSYVKTWLQFFFPIYIWVLVVVIIVASYYSSTAARLAGSNVVSVLVTLFLLSYAKLLRIIITVFQPTIILVNPAHYQRRVWLYDGNVDYLKGKHIPLFIFTLMLLVVLTIPYTTSLLFIQWLRKVNHLRVLFWVRKLKPLFDAHTGPYKDKHGYWTGLLLTVRVTLFMVFSLNISGDASVNLLATSIITTCLLTYLSLVGGVYKSLLNNVIEISFYMNLSILTVTTYFNRSTPSPGITNTSTGIALFSFILITFYHVYLRFASTRRGIKLWKHFKTILEKPEKAGRVKYMHSTSVESAISHSSLELREELLKDNTP